MKKLIPLLLSFGVCLWAADFWKEKPFTDWSDKDIQKMESNSPWSKEVAVSLGQGGGSGESTKGGRGGGGGGGGGRGGGGGDSDSGGGGRSLSLTVSWRTALPVRQAFAKQKFGAEAETSADAKKLLGEAQKSYVILVSGLPGKTFRGEDKDALMKSTSLTVKGKDPIVPNEVQTGGMNQKAVVVFIFPRTAIDLDDKEIEFSSKIGRLVVKEKFHLKDMVFNGKLEL